MIYNNMILHVDVAADIETVKRLLKRCANLSREEQGCERFEVYQSNEDPSMFFLIERWHSQAALEKHRKQHAFKYIYTPDVLSKASRVPHPSSLVA